MSAGAHDPGVNLHVSATGIAIGLAGVRVPAGDVEGILAAASALIEDSRDYWRPAGKAPRDLTVEISDEALFPSGIAFGSSGVLKRVHAWAKGRRVAYGVLRFPDQPHGLRNAPAIVVRWGRP